MKGVFKIRMRTGCSLEDEATDGFKVVSLPRSDVRFPVYNVSMNLASLVHNESMQWALKVGKYQKSSGSPGPSIADVVDSWTHHKLSEKTQRTLLETLFDNLIIALATICSIMFFCLLVKCCVDGWMRKKDQNRLSALDRSSVDASEAARAARATAQAARTEANLAVRMRDLEDRERRLDEEERRSLADEPLMHRRSAYSLGLPRSSSLRGVGRFPTRFNTTLPEERDGPREETSPL